MAASSSGRDDFMSDINVTPLVDVMLVLLVVMMVTASYVVTQALKVDLPKSSSGAAASSPLMIEIGVQGDLHMNGHNTNADGVRTEIQRQRSLGQDPSCVIAADGGTAHRHVVGVMDVLREESVSKVAIGVQPKP